MIFAKQYKKGYNDGYMDGWNCAIEKCAEVLDGYIEEIEKGVKDGERKAMEVQDNRGASSGD